MTQEIFSQLGNSTTPSVWKMSHGKPDKISNSDNQWLVNNSYIAQGYDLNGDKGKGQGKKFASMKDGDYFYLVRNASVVLLGKIVDDEIINVPQKLTSIPSWYMRKFELVKDISANNFQSKKVSGGEVWKPQGNSTVAQVKEDGLLDFEKQILIPAFQMNLKDLGIETKHTGNQINYGNKDIMLKKEQQSLNKILYGPPGTGKTYNTINKALEIIGENVEGKPRQEIKEIFDAKMQEGQIVFTTFHQSMSYEDFIEGIKPIEPKQEGQQVNYKVVDGIFKKSCAIAGYNSYKLFNNSKEQAVKYSFDDLYDAFIDDIQVQIDNKTPPIYKSLRGKDTEVKGINSNDSIIARAKNSKAKGSAPLTKENLQKLYDKFKKIEEITDLQQVKDTVQITPRITEFYAVFSGLKTFEEEKYNPDITDTGEIEALDHDEVQKKFNAGVYNEAIKNFSKNAEPVVLIIDEINRGNISQIFGELITLIEDDKRLGKDEALEVTLPYSKEKFGVPSNLYIIGTMNTADRSVEALDAALRRRFSFEEMLPDPELIDTEVELELENGNLNKIELRLLFNTINKRIEKLLDKDHQIGHSYFLSISSVKDLKMAFQSKIIPLLQEYFFGDYGKIGLVLGKGFFEDVETPTENLFADFYDYDASEFSERTIYKIKNISNISDDKFMAAINSLLVN